MTTPKQLMVLQAIQWYIKEHHYPPTVREIADLVGLKSSSTVHGYLDRLRKAGLIEWEADKPRTLKVLCRVIE